MRTAALTILILILGIMPVYSQDEVEVADPEIHLPEILAEWDLPGSGAGRLYVNPADGAIWTFLHQSKTIGSINGDTGYVELVADLTLTPTAMDFSTDGTKVFVVGEPRDDQRIDVGIFQVLDASDGTVVYEMELNGACNAVFYAGDGVVYVTCGMQYAYQGTVYRLVWDEELMEFVIGAQADCGKIPWAVLAHNDVLYVTDYELQWTEQVDGSMGPPYGAWVWTYDSLSLELIDKHWVGINPNRLAVINTGVLVGCSGSKQSEGDFAEPTLNLLPGKGETESFFIGTSGASDLAVTQDGLFAFVTIADWSEPVATSSVGIYTRMFNPDGFPEAKRWVYTGDIALCDFHAEEPTFERFNIVDESYLKAVAVSLDGTRLFCLQDEPEKVLVINLVP